MKLFSYRTAWALGISVAGCAAGAGLAACSSSSSSASPSGQSSPDGSTGNGACTDSLQILFNPMYSAFIPGSTTHSFLVPAVVSGVSGASVKWTASDPSAVGFQADSQTGGTTITVLKPGTVTIHATIGGVLCGSAPLTVTQNTEDDWSAGNLRYNNGVTVVYPSFGTADGGAPMGPPPGSFTPGGPSPLEPKDGGPGPACTNCHGLTATTGIFRGIEHTPEQTAGFSDQELVDIVVNGIIPDGGVYDSDILSYRYWQLFHKWADLSDAEKRGIVVYLRSLPPSPQTGKLDFGGAFGRDGGGNGPPTGDDGSTPSGDDSGSDATVTPADAGADATHE